MICVSIAEPTIELVLQSMQNEEFAEIRLDAIKDLTTASIWRIFSQNVRLVATCRSGYYTDAEKVKFLCGAIDAGATYVDIEVDASDDLINKIVSHAHTTKTKVIMSYHNFDKTPVVVELEEIVDWCFKSGADVAKIVCKAKSPAECARILSLYESGKPIIAFGLGSENAFTRVASLFLGAPFTYVSKSHGKETAEGQIEKGRMIKILELIKNGI